ncbi:hypothetical protein Lalb_Chr19g0128331 [Lupinus albus]|uniref:Uncharacterized protein n=1 Tax=Lupinus albus TaxID=3870 RepID=A0A6A4NWX9_LUPAL|nr:hypothetical protein Lalb_Chr19g0128331 [Lupinus albus]
MSLLKTKIYETKTKISDSAQNWVIQDNISIIKNSQLIPFIDHDHLYKLMACDILNRNFPQ